MIDPIRMWGTSRRSGYVLDWGVDGASSGSLLSVRMIRPKAWVDRQWAVWIARTNMTYLGRGVHQSTDGQDPLDRSPRIVTNGAFGTGQFPNLRHVLTTLADDRGRFGAGDDGPHMDPGTLNLMRVL